jgi:CheY-like chemotaxis protein
VIHEHTADTKAYRVLIVDDERAMCEAARREIVGIADSTKIYVDEAYTARVAISKVRSSYFDLILLDLYRERVLAGYEVYRALNELGCSADVIFMTRFNLDPSAQILLRAVASGGSARPVGFIDKREGNELIRVEIAKRYEKFAAAQLTISNLPLASEIIDKRRGWYKQSGVFPLRDSLSEIDIEVDRMLRRLYVELPPSLARTTGMSVSLKPIERRGTNAAVILNAAVDISFSGADDIHGGQNTILKIGPKPDILEEASRFSEFVRYGVALNQRPEMLGVATGDSLGALVYSFAGGVYQRDLASLDDMLVRSIAANSLKLSSSALKVLFDSRNWYAVQAGEIEVSQYFEQNYGNDLMRSFAQSEEALLGLGEAFGDGFQLEKPEPGSGQTDFTVSFGELDRLIIPDSSVLGHGTIYGAAPACLVYGDMDAGNVLLETSQRNQGAYTDGELDGLTIDRACLINFRNAGPGPRTIDAAALEASVRLADAEAACLAINRLGESRLSATERFDAAKQMAGRVRDEINLYRGMFGQSLDRPTQGWQVLASDILVGLQKCVLGVTLQEYLSTSIRYTIRQLGQEMTPVARVRILSWLAAQYSLLREVS